MHKPASIPQGACTVFKDWRNIPEMAYKYTTSKKPSGAGRKKRAHEAAEKPYSAEELGGPATVGATPRKAKK